MFMALVGVAMLVAAVVDVGIQYRNGEKQAETAEKQEKLQKEAQAKQNVRQFKTQTMQKFRDMEQAAQVRMAAGSTAKQIEFKTKLVKAETTHATETLSKNEHKRTERYMGKASTSLN